MNRNPLLLHLLCVAGFLGAFLKIPEMASPEIWKDGVGFAAYVSLSTALGVTALGGLWALRRWGFFAYAFYAALNQAVYLARGHWDFSLLVLPLLTLGAGIFYYRWMK